MPIIIKNIDARNTSWIRLRHNFSESASTECKNDNATKGPLSSIMDVAQDDFLH